MCSSAMLWGMPYERFWHCNWSEFFAYMRTYQMAEERKAEWLDTQAWKQGIYIKLALQDVYPLFNALVDTKKIPKKGRYPIQPLHVIEQKKKEVEQETDRIPLEERIRQHNEMIAALKK